LDCILVGNLIRRVLIPVVGLGRIRVLDFDLVDPVGWLGIIGIIDFLLRIDWWVKIYEEGARSNLLVINKFDECLIRVDDQGVQLGSLSDRGSMGRLVMFLFIFPGDWVLVTEDEMKL